jgi:hypothetical protein
MALRAARRKSSTIARISSIESSRGVGHATISPAPVAALTFQIWPSNAIADV